MAYYDKYFEAEKQYQERYGNEVIILKEMGMFYEIFERNDCKISSKINQILNIAIIERNDIYRMGFPLQFKDKYIKLLLEIGYVVIILDHNWQEEIYLQG